MNKALAGEARATLFLLAGAVALIGATVGVGRFIDATVMAKTPVVTPQRGVEAPIYPARVIRVVDGDTLEIQVELGMDVSRTTKVRLAGVDTPEVFGKDKARGLKASEFTKAWVARTGGLVDFVDFGDDKYGGRRDGALYPRDSAISLAEELRTAGHIK